MKVKNYPFLVFGASSVVTFALKRVSSGLRTWICGSYYSLLFLGKASRFCPKMGKAFLFR
jgi:hypothetical protein